MAARLTTIDPQDPLHPLLLDALRHVWSPAQGMAKAAPALPPAQRGQGRIANPSLEEA